VSPVARTYLTGWSETEVTTTYSTSTQVVGGYKLYASDYVGGTTSADLTTAVLSMENSNTPLQPDRYMELAPILTRVVEL